MGPRIRQSIQVLVDDHANGNTSPLENLIRAFRNIQKLPSNDPDSFESIAGNHGEPFTELPPDPIEDYWGGYCHHENILFPTWHRAYVLRLEKALQDKGPDPNLALPFWDECAGVTVRSSGHPLAPTTPIPAIFTTKELTFEVDGSKGNPLYSYTLQNALNDNEAVDNRYSKPAGYETTRYPLSGLVGNDIDRALTQTHNDAMTTTYPTPDKLGEVLNANVRAWLQGTVVIDKTGDDPKTIYPDLLSVYTRFSLCLAAPNYPVFSNRETKNGWLKSIGPPEEWTVEKHGSGKFFSLEEPHNAIHLALGGFYQYATFNANAISGANGDMGENNTAAFDPIFWFHHCFIDYMFWQWQIRHEQTKAIVPFHKTLEMHKGFDSEGMPKLAVGTLLDFDTPLWPFRKPQSTDMYTSNDVIDIEKNLDYTFGPGSFADEKPPLMEGLANAISKLLIVDEIHRPTVQQIVPGSFVIRTFIDDKDGKSFEIGRTEILSRYNPERCANCQNHLAAGDIIPLHESILPFLKAGGQDLDQLNVQVKIQTHLVSFPAEPATESQSETPPASRTPSEGEATPSDIPQAVTFKVTWK